MNVPAPLWNRRSLLAGAGLLALAAGCGSPDGGTTVSSVPGYPVTIPHRLGSATIPAPPRRVVTLGASNTDVALALGVLPVAVPRVTYGGGPDGLLPWVRDAIAATGGPAPRVIGRELTTAPVEEVAAAAPDLVLATYSGLTADEYAQLSAIAPTVAYPDAAYATGWREQMRIAGLALGRPDVAARTVAETDALLAGATARFPELAGRTFLYSGGLDGGRLGVFRESDVRVALAADLGLTPAPWVERNAPPGEAVYYTVSPELVGTVPSDMLVAFFATQAEADAFRASPTVARIPAVIRGGLATVVGADRVAATSSPSVLSIPWVLDDYLPVLAAAAAGRGR